MKLNKIDETFVTNAKKVSNFTINSNGAVFKIFSDGLYQYKIPAVVREILWNAADSHKKAGKENVQFNVFYPTSLHRYFEVEDFGVGLSDEEIHEVYTQYFKSTKSESNDEVGGFGLGCKSPFAYTDSFTVRTRKDGIERMYRCYFGNDYAPCISKTYEKETELENGVKVSIGVKEQDLSRFESEIRWVVSFMKNKPRSNLDHIENLYFVKDEDLESLYSGGGKLKSVNLDLSDPRIPNSQIYTRKSDMFAFVGGVIYPLNIEEELKKKNSKEDTFIPFEIGEVEIAPSRESLSLTETTKEVVENRISLININFLEHEQEKVSLLKTNKEIVDYYYECSNWLRDGLIVNGKSLKTYVSVNNMSRATKVMVGLDSKGKYPYKKQIIGKLKKERLSRSREFLVFKEMTPLKLSRLEKIYYTVEIVEWSKLLEKFGITRNLKEKKSLKKEQKNSFFSTGYSSTMGKFEKSEITEDSLKSFDYVCHVNYKESDKYLNHEGYYTTACNLKNLMSKDKKIIVLFSNKTNLKKIENLGILHAAEIFKKVIDNFTDEEKNGLVDSLLSRERYRTVSNLGLNDLADYFMYEIGSNAKSTQGLYVKECFKQQLIEKRVKELGFLDNPVFKEKITLDFMKRLHLKED